jgi:hypothetical protein
MNMQVAAQLLLVHAVALRAKMRSILVAMMKSFSRGILQEVQTLLQKYRSELLRQSQLLDQGGRA